MNDQTHRHPPDIARTEPTRVIRLWADELPIWCLDAAVAFAAIAIWGLVIVMALRAAGGPA